MSRPRYRTLDGIERELPVQARRHVLVPTDLARNEPDLTWALEYDDAPPIAPQVRDELGGDPMLDFSEGALLVPLARWDAQARLDPALVASRADRPDRAVPLHDPRCAAFEAPTRHPRRLGIAAAGRRSARLVTGAATTITTAVQWTIGVGALAFAISFAAAAAQWLTSFRDGPSSAELGSGALLLGSAMLLAALLRRACSGQFASPSGEAALAIGHAARAIFMAGATLIAIAMMAFSLGLGR